MSDTTPSDVPASDGDRPALPERLAQRFVLEELIGRGTCSEVYRARDVLLDRAAAVKVFPMAGDPRNAREVSLLASLDHPSLVAIYDVGAADGRAFVVMTLLEGGNLLDRLASGPLPVADTLLAVAAVADGLGHVHRGGVLHRDVTPRNVLFDVDGRAHLSDFGVALVVDAPRISDTGIIEGSAPYLAPEQLRGEVVGAPADVYALGLVMIEALTARPAYPGSPLEAANARLEHGPELPTGLDADVVALLTAMTADDPAARPSADDVCVGLRRAALAAETSATIVPVAPMTGVGLACAVDGTTVGMSPVAAMTPAVGTTAAAAVAVPAAARRSTLSSPSGPESAETAISPVAGTTTPAETPFDVRTRSAGAELAANARGLVVVGSVLASIVLAGGVVFASAWTVDSTSTAAPPYATVPPSTAEIAGAPDAGSPGSGSGSSSRHSSGSTSDESTDGGSARQVYRDRSADDVDDDAPSRSRTSSSETTETTETDRRTSDATSSPGTSSESRSSTDVPSAPSVPDLPSVPSLPTSVSGLPTVPSLPTSVSGPPLPSLPTSVSELPTSSTSPSESGSATSSTAAPTSSTATSTSPTTTTTTTTTTTPTTRRASNGAAGNPSLEALGNLFG